MSIELHCPQCEKLIRAPDNAGGKHGKCPYCEAKVYIPMPPAGDEDEIKIAPLDSDSERRDEELHREMVRYSASLDKEKDAPMGAAIDAAVPSGGPASRRMEVPGEVIDVPEKVEEFIVAMRDSQLDDADRVAKELKRTGSKARDYVEGIMLDPTPPPLGNVPKPLLQGFLKALLQRL
jgi:hypothetical protein